MSKEIHERLDSIEKKLDMLLGISQSEPEMGYSFVNTEGIPIFNESQIPHQIRNRVGYESFCRVNLNGNNVIMDGNDLTSLNKEISDFEEKNLGQHFK